MLWGELEHDPVTKYVKKRGRISIFAFRIGLIKARSAQRAEHSCDVKPVLQDIWAQTNQCRYVLKSEAKSRELQESRVDFTRSRFFCSSDLASYKNVSIWGILKFKYIKTWSYVLENPTLFHEHKSWHAFMRVLLCGQPRYNVTRNAKYY